MHSIENKEKLLLRTKKIKGQMSGIERLIENGGDCFKILQQLSAVRGAVIALMGELLDAHIKEHLSGEIASQARDEEIANLRAILKSFFK